MKKLLTSEIINSLITTGEAGVGCRVRNFDRTYRVEILIVPVRSKEELEILRSEEEFLSKLKDLSHEILN